jgi:hypothetical protein
VAPSVERAAARKALAADLTELKAKLAANETFGKPAEAKAIRDAAEKALAIHAAQVQQLDTAPIALGESAWTFGLDLMTNADRGEQNVEQLVRAISEQTESVTKFGAAEEEVTDPGPGAEVLAFVGQQTKSGFVRTPDELSLDVARKTAILMEGLVNIEALVLGFDKCAATALAGGTPKADRIQRVAFP